MTNVQTTKGERTRSRIVEEAAPVFNQRGYEGASLQDIMEATGLEKGGLYRHFSSKEELAAECFRYAWGLSMERRSNDLKDVEGAIAKLKRVVQLFATRPSVVPGGCALMNTAVEADDGNPKLRRLALGALRQWRGQLTGIVEEGIGAGEIRKDVDPCRLANRIIATLEGALMISRLERNHSALEDVRLVLIQELDGIQA
jgi:TetR/AcrR family transcriptional regulator, transcriptional repressor for nem operon